MYLKKISIFIILFLATNDAITQSIDDLKIQKKAKHEELAKLNKEWKKIKNKADKVRAEIKLLEDSLKVYPIWTKGIFGTLGFNFTRSKNWLSKNESNTTASTIGYSLNGFLNLEEKKYFWKNTLKLNQSWLKFDNKEVEEDVDEFQIASDAYNFNSLWGYKFSKKMAASALIQYRTALLEKRFNNPGFLDIGFGSSWTPLKNMVLAFHPINYNAVFSDVDLASSFGLKVIAEYSGKFSGGFNWTTNFSGFASYKNKNLNNWSWTNGLSKSFKWIGVGLDVAFKQNRQEAIARELEDNPLQFYYILGLSYKF